MPCRLAGGPRKMKRISFSDLGKEPFRLFFPTAVIAGILGVSLWPLYFSKKTNALGIALRIAFGALISGFILVAIFPAYRVGLLHLTLIGGFAVIAFTVATRVIFGHSGNLEKLKAKNRWLLVALGLMLFGMATRISGDFWPKIMASHYS